MSVEEDTELRDLVAQTLETNGVLNKIRVCCFGLEREIYIHFILSAVFYFTFCMHKQYLNVHNMYTNLSI